MREPMDAIANRRIETVVIMASAQIAKTEVLLNLIGYHMHMDPCPMMFIQPTLDLALAVSKDRVAPMISSTPALQGLVGLSKSRDSSNTLLHKSFFGGHLTLSGANSPASLASRPIRILLADEVDRWPESVGAEGDPLTLAVKRTLTYRRRKIIITSSPTVKDASRIEDWWNLSDRRRLHVPCPRCEARFVPQWANVRWDSGDASSAHIQCPICDGEIEDSERMDMVAAGAWKPEVPTSKIAGFHIWELYSPWRTLEAQVTAFLASRGSLEMRQAWANTSEGVVWEVPGDRVEPGSLLMRREKYPTDLPAGVRILTCGVDTQDDRIEALVVGWGDGEESWVISRETGIGDPEHAETWAELDELLDRDFEHELGGTMRIGCTLVDAGGHRTQSVYKAIIPRQARRVYASFGRAGGESGLLVSPAKVIRPKSGTGNVLRRIVGVDQAKSLLYSRLKLVDQGREYVHFPEHLGETFFDELTAEKLMTKRNKFGVPTKTWEQIRDRNESLDCFVLALAALRILAPTPAAFARVAGKLEQRRGRI